MKSPAWRFVVVLGLSLVFGCASTPRMPAPWSAPVVFYLDGAGGGGLLTDWGAGVREGLRLAGADAEFRQFVWQTGLGLAADQMASLDYKRERAAALAKEITALRRSAPRRPIHVVGLSAGTAVAVFALEALPDGCAIDTLVLLGSSLSSHYELSPALAHVDRCYVFVSREDRVLSMLVPLAGTADRERCGACSAGLLGFHWPPQADPHRAQLYSRLENIDWRPEFAAAGHFGGHTDAVNASFVRAYVAPLVTRVGPRFSLGGSAPAALP